MKRLRQLKEENAKLKRIVADVRDGVLRATFPIKFLHEGVIEEAGAPAELFTLPKSERFRQFLSGRVDAV